MMVVDRRTFLSGTGLLTGAITLSSERENGPFVKQRTILVCHGAFSAGWAWKKMRALWHVPGQSQLFVPTMTGVGERKHLASTAVNLTTHIEDVIGVMEMENLHDITLIGHSYGGMVATGVAGRNLGRIAQLIYLDAFVPQNGETLYDITGQVASKGLAAVPPRPIPDDTEAADRKWMEGRRTPQPIGCFTTPVVFEERSMPPRSYIRCTRTTPDDPLQSSYQRAVRAGWPVRNIDASHSPNITAPGLLADTVASLLI